MSPRFVGAAGAQTAERSAVADAWLLTKRLIWYRLLAGRRDWSGHQLYIVATAAGGVLFWLIFFGAYLGMKALEAAGATGLITTVAAWAFLIYLFTDIFIAFGQALNDLYMSSDIPLLFAMPLRIPSVIVAKFVLGVAQNEMYVGVFLLPFVLGFLFGMGAPWWAYVISIFGVALFPAILYAALVVVTIVALRFIPARIAKEILWLAGASIPTIFWIASFARLAHLSGNISTMRLPSPPGWLPSTWLGHGVTAAGLGMPGQSLAWIGLLTVVTLGLSPVVLAVVSRAFSSGYDASASRGSTLAGEFGREKAAARLKATVYPTTALLRKDFLVFARSPQLWFNHIAALGFVGYLLVGHKVQTPLLPLTTQLAMVQMGFVAALNSLNPGMIALSLERGSIWLLKSMPIPTRDVLVAKIAGAFLQTAFISGTGAILLGIGYGFSIGATAALVVFALLIAAASISRGVAFDTRFPSFTWENPNSINRGIRMVLPFLNSLGILLVCGFMLFAARFRFHHSPLAVFLGLILSSLVIALIVERSLVTAMKNLAALEV